MKTKTKKSFKKWKFDFKSFTLKYCGINELVENIDQDNAVFDKLHFGNAIAENPGIWGIKSNKTNKIIFKPQFLYEPRYAYFDSFVVYKGDLWKKEHGVYKSNNQKCGVIDLKGNEIIPFEYEHIKAVWKIGSDESDKKYIVCKNNKWGVIDQNREVVLPIEFDEIDEDTIVAEYSFFCKKNKKTLYVIIGSC
ncbi:MAG: WG repeat-containing protein [Clostridia bacterium]|nr:WG repeat-containing protein [Clostridia bacterium]